MSTVVKELTTRLDDRGYLVEILRNDDPFFKQFGQVYTSAIHPGVVKGFHKHSKQTEHITCVHGQVKLVLVDDRSGHAVVEEYHLSPLSPKMVVVPPEVWYGWCSASQHTSLLINVTDTAFDEANPDAERVDPHQNPWGYAWGRKDR